MKGIFVPSGNLYSRFNEPSSCCLETAFINGFIRDSLSKGIRRLEDIEIAMKVNDTPMYKFYELVTLRDNRVFDWAREEIFKDIKVRGNYCYLIG